MKENLEFSAKTYSSVDHGGTPFRIAYEFRNAKNMSCQENENVENSDNLRSNSKYVH